jgi:hypothetical protein
MYWCLRGNQIKVCCLIVVNISEHFFYIFTKTEICKFSYKNDTGKISLMSREKCKALKTTLSVEQHPLPEFVYLMQPDYVQVYSLIENKIVAKFLIGNGNKIFFNFNFIIFITQKKK